MINSGSKDAEQTLSNPDAHDKWANSYRVRENEGFYEQAFDYIADILHAPSNSTILDAGCGACAHSMRLASRGFSVVAIDFSEYILKIAAAKL